MSNADDLHDLSSRLALRALADDYASGCDRRDAALFVSAFHEDAVLVVHAAGDPDTTVATLRGHERLARVPGMLERYEKTFHFIGNTRYEIDALRATGEVYCLAHHLSRQGDESATNDHPDGSDGSDRSDLVMFVRYLDTYRRASGRWAIDERQVMVDWTEQRSVVPDASSGESRAKP
ncbi:MAG: nuclear transport factor 2 family protein [Acidimicrobiia bacterium]